MHDLSTRAWTTRRQSQVLAAAALAVLLSSAGAAWAASTQELSAVPDLAPPRTEAAHEIRIQFVKPGGEGLELSARLTEDGDTIARPIAWKIKSLDGDIVYQGEAPMADVATVPGDYLVELTYGAVTINKTVTLLERQRLGVSFVLNVGGIRVLPRVASIGLPLTRAETQIFATSGLAQGRLVASSSIPGEIIRVGAGSYRIESRFDPGNTLAVAEVKVKPGILSAVEIDHDAGLAHLRVANPKVDSVQWTITPDEGEAIEIDANAADVVLKPGSYETTARIGADTLSARFEISAGQARNVVLGQ